MVPSWKNPDTKANVFHDFGGGRLFFLANSCQMRSTTASKLQKCLKMEAIFFFFFFSFFFLVRNQLGNDTAHGGGGGTNIRII